MRSSARDRAPRSRRSGHQPWPDALESGLDQHEVDRQGVQEPQARRGEDEVERQLTEVLGPFIGSSRSHMVYTANSSNHTTYR